jgi:hypothetical protein
MNVTTIKAASPKQIEWIEKMLVQKDLKASVAERIQNELNAGMSSKQASQWLDWLFSDKVKDKGAANTGPEAGFYQVDEVIYRVKISKSGNWYAEEAILPVGTKNRINWEYIGKNLKYSTATKLTAQEAGRFTSYCMYCGAKLDDPTSRYNGIGPDCASNRGIKREKPPVAEQQIGFEFNGQEDEEAQFQGDAPQELDDIYWSNEAAKHEAEQERKAMMAKFLHRQATERF